jgi:hypothetical protein
MAGARAAAWSEQDNDNIVDLTKDDDKVKKEY